MLELQHNIDFDNADTVCRHGIEHIRQSAQDIHVDCQSLEHFKSVILSVLLCWMRESRKQGLSCVLVNAPARLKEMARVYGLANIINFK